MIYLATSVALAQLLAEDRLRPRPGYTRLRPGTLLNSATDYGRNEASDGEALRELLKLNLMRGE